MLSPKAVPTILRMPQRNDSMGRCLNPWGHHQAQAGLNLRTLAENTAGRWPTESRLKQQLMLGHDLILIAGVFSLKELRGDRPLGPSDQSNLTLNSIKSLTLASDGVSRNANPKSVMADCLFLTPDTMK